jgi:hypothetical protein
MNQLLSYIISLVKVFDQGQVPSYPDPTPPTDLGSALTQDEIDFVKKLKKEMDERFTAL